MMAREFYDNSVNKQIVKKDTSTLKEIFMKRIILSIVLTVFLLSIAGIVIRSGRCPKGANLHTLWHGQG